MPKKNRKYWTNKIKANADRDKRHSDELDNLGWSVLTIWECETRNQDAMKRRIIEFLNESSA